MSVLDSGKKKLLHIGCGPQHILGKHGFDPEEWEEIRLDVEASVQPDIIGTMTDMKDVATGSVNAIFSSHNLEHLVPHELPVAMSEFLRVLEDDGYLVVTLPDLQQVARLVAQDKLDEPAYHTGAGLPICPMDILYGWRLAMANGQPYMAHRMGFTARTLQKALMQAGFGSVAIKRGNGDFALYAVASKPKLTSEALLELFNRHWSGGGWGTNTLAGRKEEPAVNIAEPSECSPKRSLEKLYLYTLKKSLLGDFYLEDDVRFLYLAMQGMTNQKINWNVLVDPKRFAPQLYEHVRKNKEFGNAWYLIPSRNQDGSTRQLNFRNQTDFAYSMIGQKRMDNIESCLDIIRAENIPGDLIETGVCRGGAVIFMEGYLKTYGMTDRKVFAADSFEGLPLGKNEDEGIDFSKNKYPVLAISLERVKETFARYGLLEENVVFLKGWFKDSLPVAPVEKLALLRMDGDLYESTMDALTNLYDKVVPGGFVIIDDYLTFEVCKKAVDEFREDRGINDPIIQIDPMSAYWRKS